MLIDLDKFIASMIEAFPAFKEEGRIPCMYKEALEAQGLEYKDGEIVKTQRMVSSDVKEDGCGVSEDKRIMEKIIATIRLYYGVPLEDEAKEMIVWLEKQGSEPNWCHHKVDLSNCSEEYRKAYYDGWNNCNQQHSQCKSERNDVVKCLVPKFKVGDWVLWDNKISCHIDNIYQGKESLMYTITDTNNMIRSYSVKSFDNNARLWTIQDAKDGDVLAEDSCIFIIQKYGDNTTEAKTYYTLYDDGDFDDGTILYFDIDSTKPATKEQRDMLFQKMHEAGYTFDFEKKELKKLKFRVGDEVITENEESLTITKIDEEGYWSNDLFICDFDSECVWDLVKQKPAEWKQENREELTEFENAMMHIGGSFFGENAGLDPNDTATIKEQAKLLLELAPKTEWSEEDEKNLRRAIRATEVVYPVSADWLKSIRNRIPSDEQKTINDTDEDIVETVKDTSILDMVEPKFKVGDIVQHITDITDTREIEEVDTYCNMYHTDSSPIMFEIEDEWKVVVNAEDVEQNPAEWSGDVKELYLENTLIGFQNRYAHENSGEFPSAIEIAKHFYELGLKASDTELEKLIWTLPESIGDKISHQVYLMSLYHCDGQCVVDYVGESEEDSLVCFEGETFMEAATKMREWIRKRKSLYITI